MKAERRQELRTNELAQMLDDSREFFRAWGSYILGGVVIVALIVAFTVYRAKAADEQLSEAWKSLQGVSFFDAKGEKKPDEDIRAGFTRLEELAQQNHGPDFLFEVLSSQAQSALRLAGAPKTGVVDTTWLDKAAEAYEAMRTRLPENSLAVAMALNGLANVEADRFVVDGDLDHKKKAEQHLVKLKDDPRFLGTPFQRAALERINQLDEVFRRVEFTAAPTPPPPVSLNQSTTAPAITLTPDSEQPVPLPTPEPGSEAPPVEMPSPEPEPSAEEPEGSEPPADAAPDAPPTEPE